MKIGKISFDLHFEPNDGKFFVTMEQESVTLKQEEVQQGPRTGKVENSTASDEVQLDPDSDDFAEKKSALKAAGFFYNRSTKTWRKKKGSAPSNANGSQTQATQPTSQESSATNIQADWFGDATEIQLAQDDADFDKKKESLKAAGFKWHPTAKAWRKPDQ